MKFKTTKHYWSHRRDRPKVTFWPTQPQWNCRETASLLQVPEVPIMKSAFSSEAFSWLALKESYKLQVLRHIFLCKHGQKVTGRKKGNLLVLLKKKVFSMENSLIWQAYFRLLMNQANSQPRRQRGGLKSCTRREIFVDQHEQKLESNTGHLFIG